MFVYTWLQALVFHAWTAFWSNISRIDDAAGEITFSQPSSAAIGQYTAGILQMYINM